MLKNILELEKYIRTRTMEKINPELSQSTNRKQKGPPSNLAANSNKYYFLHLYRMKNG
jgi:hypothetical protein